jgi:superfamily I DNA/RNA helicase/mRNA-degrading endonuclease RelE of RelBE toxin-antitoxin system
MAFELEMADTFLLELSRAPEAVKKSYSKNCFRTLRERPHISDPPKIKKIKAYKDFWRYRLSEKYRLVYQVNLVDNVVKCLILDKREDVYGRMGSTPDGPGIRIVANRPDLIEEPAPEDLVNAPLEEQDEGTHLPEDPLPRSLDRKALSAWGVNPKYHDALLPVATGGELLELNSKGIPDEEVTRVLNALYPPRIEQVTEQPARLIEDEKQIEQAVNGERSLQAFLLRLDEDQRTFVQRIGKRGPWLLKGGPGSGKSTVALYCIRSILNKARSSFLDEVPKILFTTYTHALTRAARQLATELDCSEIEITNVNKFASDVLREQKLHMTAVADEQPDVRDVVTDAINECVSTSSEFSFTPADHRFVLKEIRWIIVGRGIETKEDYLTHPRIGCGRALQERQRSDVWQIYERYKKRLRELNKQTYTQELAAAANAVTKKYDYVFIDEAQDLPPVAIRLCINACKTKDIFITADHNQSIYGAGLSWAQVTDELSFTGKSRILQNNYRTTVEMWNGLQQLFPSNKQLDEETSESRAQRHGAMPIVSYYGDETSQIERLNSFLHDSLMKERVGLGFAAVLCPTNKIMNEIAQRLDRSLNARAMPSKDVDLSHRGVKVMTMHAAKGLQFPVVAVANIEAGKLPWPISPPEDRDEHEASLRRAFFVACSRSTSRLLLMVPSFAPSPFVESLTGDHWTIEGEPADYLPF